MVLRSSQLAATQRAFMATLLVWQCLVFVDANRPWSVDTNRKVGGYEPTESEEGYVQGDLFGDDHEDGDSVAGAVGSAEPIGTGKGEDSVATGAHVDASAGQNSDSENGPVKDSSVATGGGDDSEVAAAHGVHESNVVAGSGEADDDSHVADAQPVKGSSAEVGDDHSEEHAVPNGGMLSAETARQREAETLAKAGDAFGKVADELEGEGEIHPAAHTPDALEHGIKPHDMNHGHEEGEDSVEAGLQAAHPLLHSPPDMQGDAVSESHEEHLPTVPKDISGEVDDASEARTLGEAHSPKALGDVPEGASTCCLCSGTKDGEMKHGYSWSSSGECSYCNEFDAGDVETDKHVIEGCNFRDQESFTSKEDCKGKCKEWAKETLTEKLSKK